MSKISDLVANNPTIKRYDFIIAVASTLCAVFSLSTKALLTFSGGSGAMYTVAAGYFAIGGNLILLSPKFIKSPLQKIAGAVIPFLGKKSNFAFILKTLGAIGFLVAGILEDQAGLAIGGAGFALGNIIALIKGYKRYSIAGYGMAAGAFMTSGLEAENMLLFYAGVSAILETTLLAIYKHYDESRFEVIKLAWEEEKQGREDAMIEQEELEKMLKHRASRPFSEAFMNNVFHSDSKDVGKYFQSEFAKYAHKEKQLVEENLEK